MVTQGIHWHCLLFSEKSLSLWNHCAKKQLHDWLICIHIHCNHGKEDKTETGGLFNSIEVVLVGNLDKMTTSLCNTSATWNLHKTWGQNWIYNQGIDGKFHTKIKSQVEEGNTLSSYLIMVEFFSEPWNSFSQIIEFLLTCPDELFSEIAPLQPNVGNA